jgi:hypothetical protein
MKHLVFVIHNGHITYRMDNRNGSHPLFNEQPQKVKGDHPIRSFARVG